MKNFKQLKLSVFFGFYIITIVFILELLFGQYLKFTDKRVPKYLKVDDILQASMIIPHSYLPYVLNPGIQYCIQRTSSCLNVNEFGFRSTGQYDVQSTTKSKETIRIAVIGGSTVMGVNEDSESWVTRLGDLLKNQTHFTKSLEIINGGVLGYTSLENLLHVQTKIIDFKPDVYVLNLGINDFLALTFKDEFKSDYSHFRITLHQTLQKTIVDYLPKWLLNSKVLSVLFEASGVPDRKSSIYPKDTKAYRNENQSIYNFWESEEMKNMRVQLVQVVMRNIKSMIGVIKIHNPNAQIVLSSFLIKDNPEYAQLFNQELRAMALKEKLFYIPVAEQMPSEDVFYDNHHLIPEGEDIFAHIMFENMLFLKVIKGD